MACEHCRRTILESTRWWGYWPAAGYEFDQCSSCPFHAAMLENCGDRVLSAEAYVWTALRTAQTRDIKENLMVTIRKRPYEHARSRRSSSARVKSDLLSTRTFHVVPSDILNITEELGASTGGSESFRQLKSWIENCNRHPRCQRGTVDREMINRDPAPRRLINVRAKNPYVVDLTELKLEDPALRYVPEYCTLSWCWGNSKSVMKLTTENMARFKDKDQGLPPELQAQKTFMQAIEVTKHLGKDYIWIDALCIVQEGDAWDFPDEGNKMHRIYRNSYCTIAAAASKDGAGGLYYPTDGKRVIADLAPTSFMIDDFVKVSSKGAWSVLTADMWEQQLLQSHLYTRGWVVQERLLSPRVIHFAAKQLFWDCQSVTACEVFPSGFPLVLDNEAAKYRDWRQLLQHQVELEAQSQDHSYETLWHAAIDHYTNCNLTHHTDKPLAIAGIATVLKQLQNEDYHDGLWANRMSEQLAWRVVDPSLASRPGDRPTASDKSTTNRPTMSKRIPSWSWASLQGKVSLQSRMPPLPNGWTHVAKDHSGGDIAPQLEHLTKPGYPKSALTIRSSLVEMRLSNDSEGVLVASINNGMLASDTFHIHPDSDSLLVDGAQHYALLLFAGQASAQSLAWESTSEQSSISIQNDSRWQGSGLILRAHGPETDVFRREGIFGFRNLIPSEWERLSTTWCPRLTSFAREHCEHKHVNIWVD